MAFPASFDPTKNFAVSTVATPPSPALSGTTLTVAAGEGALFPAAPFNAVVFPFSVSPSSQNAEIVRVTSKGAGDNWTIVRTQEGTSARSIQASDRIMLGVTALVIQNLIDAVTSLHTSAIPIGAMIDYGGLTAPTTFAIPDGSAVSRSTFATLLTALTFTQTGTLNATTTVTGLSSTTNMRVGAAVEGTNIPANTTITSIDSGTQIHISNSATGSGAVTLTFFPHGNGDSSTTFNLPDVRGRVTVGLSPSGGHADVSAPGQSDGVGVLFRRAKHRHTTHTHNTQPGGQISGAGSGAAGSDWSGTTRASSATDGGSGNANDSLDAPAYYVLAKIIRVSEV